MQAFKCASAVIAYISIVFRSSNGWSKIPGVSIIYHLAYLYSVCPTKRLCVVKAYGCTSTLALDMLLIKLDLPTFGKPVRMRVLALVSMVGSLPKCFLTSSR